MNADHLAAFVIAGFEAVLMMSVTHFVGILVILYLSYDAESDVDRNGMRRRWMREAASAEGDGTLQKTGLQATSIFIDIRTTQ